MSDKSFVSGPWVHDTDFHLYEKDIYQHIYAEKGKVGILGNMNSTELDITLNGSDATGRLIAASPEMYELLSKALSPLMFAGETQIAEEIEALLAKIDGTINDKYHDNYC